MKKIKKLFQSTVVKVTSLTFILLLCASVFVFFDAYKRFYYSLHGYYSIYKGDKAYKKGDLQTAISCYERGITLVPTHYQAMYNLANIYVAYEDYYSALKNYEKALKINPRYDIARIDYALILFQTYKTDEALSEYQKVIDGQPRYITIPLINKKYRLPSIGNGKKEYIYNKGVAYYNMGITYKAKSLIMHLGNDNTFYMEKAAKSYKEATKILNTYNANYNLGLIHQLMHNKNQAGYYYCKAIDIAPMEYEAHFNLAVLLNDMQKYENSVEEFKKAGLILDSKGENIKTKYIYDVLNDVNKKIAINGNNEYIKKMDEKRAKEESKNQYKAGKLVLELDDKEDISEDFKPCEGKELFLGGE